MTSTGNDPDPDLGDTSSRGPDPSPGGSTGGGTGGDPGDPAAAGSPPGPVGLWFLLACGVVTTLTAALLTWWVWGQDRVNTYGWTAYTPHVGEPIATTWTDTAALPAATLLTLTGAGLTIVSALLLHHQPRHRTMEA